MDRNIDQTRAQVERPRRHRMGMNLKHLATGVALLGTVAAGLAGLRNEAGGVPRAAHAASGITAPVIRWCYSCTYPTITASNYHFNPLTVDISGIDFTPGGAVHVDLMVAYITFAPTPTLDESSVTPVPESTPALEESAPEAMASVDTKASYTLDLPLGNGEVYHVVGGRFTSTLAAPSSTCGSFITWLVATDQATGMTSTSHKVGIGFKCS